MRNVAVIVAVLFALSACQHSRHAAGGPYYFKSFADYYADFRPVGEVSVSDAEKLQAEGYAFYKVWFNEQGQVDRYEKYYRGSVDLWEQYTYRQGKLFEAHGVGPDGKPISHSFAE